MLVGNGVWSGMKMGFSRFLYINFGFLYFYLDVAKLN